VADRAAEAQAAADEAYLDAPRSTLPPPEALEPVVTLSEALERGLGAAVERHARLVESADRPPAAVTEAAAPELDVEALRAEAGAAAERLGQATSRARTAAEARREALAGTRGGDPAALARASALAWRLSAALAHSTERAARLEAPLRARADSGSVRTGALAARLRELSAQEGEARRAAQAAAERAAEVEVGLARLGAEVEEARRRRAELTADPAEGDDPEELRAKLDRVERRREGIGQVNPLAKEEYEREKERLDELAEQREDLERSLEELERLRAELAETVEQRFAETFEAVAKHFREVAGTLFPGGEGRLELVEPGGEEGGEAGIEVVLRPAGKQVTRLQLLSGGEKALGAIAFLFALFLARPCPFYLLDEVEAALDDTNIGRFVELLRRYADRAQFIVVTHQKRTMEAADLLYGVTMANGVSELVSRRLPREQRVAGAA
jgi:chromosome segregation protein